MFLVVTCFSRVGGWGSVLSFTLVCLTRGIVFRFCSVSIGLLTLVNLNTSLFTTGVGCHTPQFRGRGFCASVRLTLFFGTAASISHAGALDVVFRYSSINFSRNASYRCPSFPLATIPRIFHSPTRAIFRLFVSSSRLENHARVRVFSPSPCFHLAQLRLPPRQHPAARTATTTTSSSSG